MSETCRWTGTKSPRIVPGRHNEDCEGGACRGCQPCREAHCRVCAINHAAGTCAACLAETREALHDIARMCGDLMGEAVTRGRTDTEAADLVGPVADPEAHGHLEASVMAGRVPRDYLADAIGEQHPLWVLGTWDMVYRDAFDHDVSELVTIADAADYLDRNLTYMAGYEHVPFDDFARDLRGCRGHLEAVLHDGEQHDRGVPCMTCGALLERAWGDAEKSDGWACPRCKRTSTEAQYRFAVAHLHREEASELTDRDCEIRTGVKAGTIRVWATRELVKRRRDSGRTLYDVADVIEQARLRGLVS